MLTRVIGHSVHAVELVQGIGWNVMLAVIPVILAYLFTWLIQSRQTRGRVGSELLAALIFGSWLAFLPNTVYLMTEWRHFLRDAEVMDPLDMLIKARDIPSFRLSGPAGFFTLYMAIGILRFIYSIRPMERVLRGWRVPFPLVAPVLFILISIGVYLGLVVRLNSWNVVSHPGVVIYSISRITRHPMLMVVIGLFALFLWVIYEAGDLWADGIADRWAALTKRSGGVRTRPASGGASRGKV